MIIENSPRQQRTTNLSMFAEAQNRLKAQETPSISMPFLLLLGPSAVGKSEIIHNLTHSGGYTYISPYTTRTLRLAETEKFHVPRHFFDRMESNGDFAAVNHLYGESYGTPNAAIIAAIEKQIIPLLDYPLAGLSKLKLPQDVQIICVYVLPPNIQVWYDRMKAANRVSTSRLKGGYRELLDVINFPERQGAITRFVVNDDHQAQLAANQINSIMNNIVDWRNTAQG